MSAEPALAPLLQGFEGGDKFGSNGMETSVYKIDLRAFQREPKWFCG